VPLLDSVRAEFADRNAPLHLLLGALSLARRLDRLLPEAPLDPPKAPQSARSEPGDHPLVYIALGLISLRKTLLSQLEPVRAAHAEANPPGEAPADAADAADAQAPRIRDLLR